MSKKTVTIWGRKFEIEIKYDCYEGEEILETQKEAASSFLKAEKSIEASLEKVKEYCIAMNPDEIGSEPIENIFKYVAPKYVFVPRNTDKHVAAIMCNYKFDQENGIAVVFENEILAKIGKQDIVL